jgi:tryptophan synthase beta subunit
VTDEEALEAFQLLSRTDGIIPALESAHALAGVCKHVSEFNKKAIIIINLSGRGDKDLDIVAEHLKDKRP